MCASFPCMAEDYTFVTVKSLGKVVFYLKRFLSNRHFLLLSIFTDKSLSLSWTSNFQQVAEEEEERNNPGIPGFSLSSSSSSATCWEFEVQERDKDLSVNIDSNRKYRFERNLLKEKKLFLNF